MVEGRNPILNGMLFQVTGPGFCAGLITGEDGSVLMTAPILRRRFAGTTSQFVRTQCTLLGWKLEVCK